MTRRPSSRSAAVLSASVALALLDGLRGPRASARRTGSGCRQRVLRLALPPDELHPAGHRRSHASWRSWALASARSTLFGIPLQQHWSYANSGDFAPTYYLQSDAPLYYYSFTDAFIASVYKSLTPAEQARFDPMITGFNPADMYAVDHIRRVLADVSRGLHRHRRVQHPQGVRLVEGRRRDRQPDQSGARPHSRLRRGSRARGDPAQRHRHAVRQGRYRAGLPDADEGPAEAAPEDDDHLGPHRPRADRPSRAGLGGGRRAHADAPPDPRGHAQRPVARSRRLRHLVGRSREVRGLVTADNRAQ